MKVLQCDIKCSNKLFLWMIVSVLKSTVRYFINYITTMHPIIYIRPYVCIYIYIYIRICNVIYIWFLQLLFGLLRLGFMTTLLSEPLISGFLTGAAMHLITSQLRHIMGVPSSAIRVNPGVFSLQRVYSHN